MHNETHAIALMVQFAERTGISSTEQPPRRYLWTDAFAVCNFLGLGRCDLAASLVDQVHRVLGHHRPDEPRTGWLSGLPAEEGEAHPTLGGLRIGKTLPERGPDDPLDPALEWDRDGQYFHYLLKWVHALDQLSRHTGDPRGNRWARELAATAHAAFTYAPWPAAPKRIFWKMSIDLTRPQVTSMGHHDPLDGFITYLQIVNNTVIISNNEGENNLPVGGPDLGAEIVEMAQIAGGTDWTTDDPLGLGGLLTDAHRLEQLARQSLDVGRFLTPVLDAAVAGIREYLRQRPFTRSVHQRLAFRELGLSIGLHAVERMWAALQRDPQPLERVPRVRANLERLAEHLPNIEAIESFWQDPAQQRADSWLAHLDINAVMLATSLAPTGYLSLKF